MPSGRALMREQDEKEALAKMSTRIREKARLIADVTRLNNERTAFRVPEKEALVRDAGSTALVGVHIKLEEKPQTLPSQGASAFPAVGPARFERSPVINQTVPVPPTGH